MEGMSYYPCLFRFEDFFEPQIEVNPAQLKEAAIKHIKGEVSAFYSYSQRLVVPMLKYYHYPAEGEDVTLHIHRQVPTEGTIDVGDFSSYQEAKAYFNIPDFPDEYPSIEDAEVLSLKRLPEGKGAEFNVHIKFGYAVYFLTLLTVLKCPTLDGVPHYFNKALATMRKFANELKAYKIDTISEEDIRQSMELSKWFFYYDGYKPSVDDILKMPIWATTFEAEKDRNKLLITMLG